MFSGQTEGMVTVLEIRGQNVTSKIMIGEKLSRLSLHLEGRRTVIITDSNVRRLYETYFPPAEIIEINPGERSKNLETIQTCYRRLLGLEADRSTVVCGIGGGVVCDVAGFAAATYLRGLAFGFAATTLLAQVDAAVGGKNGVDFNGYKNLIGTFRQPDFVLSDVHLLETLPPQEIAGGMAEVIKTAAVGDAALFERLEESVPVLQALDPSMMEKVVTACVRIKAAVVEQDEREQGRRRILNFGHTLAHAMEKTSGIDHGRAVSLGMVFAAEYSVRRHRLPRRAADRIVRLLERMRLPVDLSEDGRVLKEAVRKDKKRSGEHVKFVFLEEIGSPVIENLPLSELESAIEDLCQPG